ncbi:MAG: TIGR01777 family oxidoreductase [Pseudomonadales bacterium]
MKNVLISGATGMIGTALQIHLTKAGFKVYALARNKTNEPFYYLQNQGVINLDPTIPLHAVINLAGANISDKRWNAARKQEIMDSRRVTTSLLCEALAKLPQKPDVLLSASAIGFYGNTGVNQVDETSESGEGFLTEISLAWEGATAAAKDAGIRTALLRFGLVLSPAGGVLKNFVLPLKLAVVGRIGSGRQYMSWISLDDVLQVIGKVMEDKTISGPLNLVSNQPVTNGEFSRVLGKALRRFRMPPLPTAVVRLMFGEMADEALLVSSRVVSVRLEELGIGIRDTDLETTLTAMYKKK